MNDFFAILVISSGRIIYFREMVESLSQSKIPLREIKIFLMLNGEGRHRVHLYKKILELFKVNYEIKLIEGVKHSEIIKIGFQETLDYQYVLLCEDDWLFSPNLSSENLTLMCKKSKEFRQVCFSNEERIQEIASGVNRNIYFTFNPSVISRNVRLRILENYDWDLDKSILDELEKNFAKLLHDMGGLYLFESTNFIVRHIGVFSTRHYLKIYRKLGIVGEFIILFVSRNRVLKKCYLIFFKFSQRLLLSIHKLIH